MYPLETPQHAPPPTEKPKRTPRKRRQRGEAYRNIIRAIFITAMLIPTVVFFMRTESGFVADSIAITIMITAGVYLLYQGVVYTITTYIRGDD